MKKRVFALMLSILLIVVSASVAFATEQPQTTAADSFEVSIPQEDDEPVVYNYQAVASNDRFTLYMDNASTFVCVQDNATGQKWYSNPPVDRTSDPYAEGIARTDMRSVLGLTYTNSELKEKITNSAAASVDKETFTVKNVENGVRIDYEFEEAKIVIPVQYTLIEDGLKAEILFSEIQQNSTNTVNTIEFMKYFGAAPEGTEGYMVIPDGSGAIVEFDNKKNANEMIYSKDFYGRDMANVTETDMESSRSEQINLPVFGMVQGDYGFLAEVTSGAESASLNAATSGNVLVGAYNILYTTVTYRVNYEIALMGQVASDTMNAMYNAQDPISTPAYAIEYHFSNPDEGEKTTYTSLANMYREILLDKELLTDDEVSERFYTEFYGAVTKKKSFVGIVYDARETLTSFDEAKAILEDLKAGGVDNITALYSNFSDDYFSGNLEVALSPSGSLGGQSAMTSLLDYALANDVPVSVAADFVTMYNSGNGYSTFWDVAEAINISAIEVYPFSLNGNTMATSKRPYYLIDPQKYDGAVNTLIDTTGKNGYTTLYFDEEALQLYSDLSPNGYQGDQTSAAQAAQMKKLAEADIELTMSNPNMYLMAYADYMVDIPVCSSKEILFDGDIPFLQTVLRGLKNFSGESMNITDVSQTSFLRHLEYGTDMKYSLINSQSNALLNTDHTFLYSATYKNADEAIESYADQIKERYAAFEELGNAVGQSGIVDHTRDGNVAVTTYDNGAKVIVNYGSEAVTVDGVTVEAADYAIV